MNSGGAPNPFAVLIPDDYFAGALVVDADIRLLEMMADGAGDAQIAAELHWTLNQVGYQVNLARRRYGAHNRAHLVALALRACIID